MAKAKQGKSVTLKRESPMPIAWTASAGLLVLFFALAKFGFTGLNLDAKWIFVSAIPLIIALVTSGWIKNFKGFGIEIDVALDTTGNKDIIKPIEVLDLDVIDKNSLSDLTEMKRKGKVHARCIRMILGSPKYDQYAFELYLKELPDIRHVLIVDAEGRFECLLYNIVDQSLRMGRKQEGLFVEGEISDLIEAVQTDNFSKFGNHVIRESILETDSLLDAYRLMGTVIQGRFANDQILPVIDSDRYLKGYVSKRDLQAKIADEVVASRTKQS